MTGRGIPARTARLNGTTSSMAIPGGPRANSFGPERRAAERARLQVKLELAKEQVLKRTP